MSLISIRVRVRVLHMPVGLYTLSGTVPFGLCNAPSTFQFLIQRMFGYQQCQSLLLYLDDIIVFPGSVSQHIDCVHQAVLARLQR